MRHLPYRVFLNKFSGSHYEIGLQTGRLIKVRFGKGFEDEEFRILSKSSLYRRVYRFDRKKHQAIRIIIMIEAMLRDVHPALLQEVQGFADGLGESFEKFLLLCTASEIEWGCSHFVQGGIHAHNYDATPKDEDNQLALVAATGSYAHVGFSSRYIGRLDGMNEKGLCVSLSFGGGHVR